MSPPRPSLGVVALVGGLLLAGCATGSLQGGLPRGFALRDQAFSSWDPSEAPLSMPAAVSGSTVEWGTDPFQEVQEASGLDARVRHPVGAALYVEQARQLLSHLARTPVTGRSLAPRQTVCWLLREVLEGGERVEYADVRWRAERFRWLVMVRPDGYLVTALEGMPLQRRGPLELVEGEWRVGNLAVGPFYFSRGGVFYPVTEALRRVDVSPLGELGLGRDLLNAALDGAQDATAEMAVALAQAFLHPIRTIDDLVRLPSTTALLIASSPEYFARYGAMSREDQIREAARLSTHVVTLRGGLGAAAGRMGGLGAELPMLSLTVEGQLVMRGAAAGTRVTTTAMDLGALSVLHMAGRGQKNAGAAGGGTPSKTALIHGPGRWTYKKPTTRSRDSLEYQEQVTGRPAWWVYMVGKLEFDGFKLGELLEAKGPGYCAFFNADGSPRYWYRSSGKFQEMLEQARSQLKTAQELGLRVTWHVADAKVAEYLRKIFTDNSLAITVHHTPPAR